MPDLAAIRAGYAAFARKHPTKAARRLGRIEDGYGAGGVAGDALDAVVDGLRDGLDGSVRCRKCGRELEDEQSKQRRVGPDCWAKIQKAAAA